MNNIEKESHRMDKEINYRERKIIFREGKKFFLSTYGRMKKGKFRLDDIPLRIA